MREARRHEGADIEADAVVEVGVPADRLLGEGLPADEAVMGRLAREDQLELVLHLPGGKQSDVGSGLAGPGIGSLGVDPVLEVGIGQGLQALVVEPVVVDQAGEAVLATVPEVPDEGAVVEPLAVLLEEPVAEPVVERRARLGTGLGEQPGLHRPGPFQPEGGPQDLTQPLGGGGLAPRGGDGDDAVLVGQRVEVVRLLVRPAVAEQPRHGDLERVGRAPRMSLEEPLGGVVAVGLGESVRVFLSGNLLPPIKIKCHLK